MNFRAKSIFVYDCFHLEKQQKLSPKDFLQEFCSLQCRCIHTHPRGYRFEVTNSKAFTHVIRL